MAGKLARRQRIGELLGRHEVHSQDQLSDLLSRDGLDVTQATLSRDLRDLGVSKGPGGYQLPGAPASAFNGHGPPHALERLVATQLVAAQAGGNLVVLRTQPGHANPLALEIDRSHLAEVMGTIAGDDTVFVAAKTNSQAERLLRKFRSLAGAK